MSTVQQLVKEKQQRQLKSEVSFLKSAIIGAMSYLDMADDPATAELYSKLDNTVAEVIRLEKEMELSTLQKLSNGVLMKLTYLPLISLLFNVSCGKSLSDMLNMGKKPYTKHNTDPIFTEYINNFNEEFAVKVSVPIILNDIDNSKAGVCFVWSDGYREIQINSKHWSSYSEEQREQLIFHELGHCVFNFNHDDSKMPDNCPNSIMRSFMFNKWEVETCYLPQYNHYMEDFDAKR